MNGDLLPEYKAVPTPHGYRPSYRLYVGQPERCVTYPEGPRYFATAGEAVRAAQEHVRATLNPPIRAEKLVATDELGVDEWRRQKAQQAIEEQQSVLGAIIIKGRQIEVETKRRRA